MFYGDDGTGHPRKIFHIIDRAIRLADGQLIPDKTTKTLLSAYVDCWFKRNGPFLDLYSDGESALNCDEAKSELKRLGTTLKVKAPGQHAAIIERRNAVLRHVLHMIEADLKRCGIKIPFDRILGEGIFVSNAFTFYNGVSPTNAHTGRQPACLPDPENPDSFQKAKILTDCVNNASARLVLMQ